MAKAGLPYLVITLVTLVLLDLVLIATGLFPPTENYGHPVVGWVSGRPTEVRERVSCVYPATDARMSFFERNEVGYRSSYSADELQGEGDAFEIAVTGDSHTDLCLPNDSVHFGVLEEALSERGIETAVYSHGAGGYSPLQGYMAMEEGLEAFAPDAFVLNLYTGNDFYDMLRIDDRPHFVDVDGSYEVAPPVWYQYDPPERHRRSRVLFAFTRFAKKAGVGDLILRFRYLTATAGGQGKGLGSVVAYVRDLSKSMSPDVGYPAAFSAQILNQQLFFYRFSGAAEDSMHRIRALLDLVRKEHPDLLLIMSPIPSYQLVQEQPVDSAFVKLLERLPVPYEEGVRLEAGLYERLRQESEAAGWLFVDNLESLKAYEGSERLFNDFDYHISVTANEIIGRAQASAVLSVIDGSH